MDVVQISPYSSQYNRYKEISQGAKAVATSRAERIRIFTALNMTKSYHAVAAIVYHEAEYSRALE